MVGLTGMFATLITLFLIHRRQRDVEREKRIQYWNEQVSIRGHNTDSLTFVPQNALRQNIIQLKEVARTSILSLSANGNSNRDTICSRAGSEESSAPILQHSVHKASGLRQQYRTDDYETSYDEMMVQQR